MLNVTRHKWSRGDRVVALYMYRFGIPSLGDPVEIGQTLGMGANSLIARLANYLAVATNGQAGLSNFPRADEEVYKRFGLLDREELERIARNHIAEVRQRRTIEGGIS